MLLIKSFKNYDEFKELFGITEHGNGAKSRRNKILLALYKCGALWEYARKNKNYYPFALKSMADLKTWIMYNVSTSGAGKPYRLELLDNILYSDSYEIDHLGGVCSDGDFRAIRYIKHEEGCPDRIYKMKAGKLFSKLMDETPFGRILPEQAKIWVCEEFAADWSAYARNKCDGYTLHLGDSYSDFEGIYGGFSYVGNFGSCMMNTGQHSFYKDAVNCTAAWLTNQDDEMVARCVIYDEVHDVDSDKIWRLAERQYSSNGDEPLKRLLILKLLEANRIDGYKQIGASCHDSRNFVDKDGNSIRNKRFYIECNLSAGDTLSYQDSFKNYDEEDNIADNYGSGSEDLATTESQYHGENDYYDEYHDRYVEDVTCVYYNGSWINCDSDDLEDFCYVETHQEYYHMDYVVYDENRDEDILKEDSYECIDGCRHYYEDCVPYMDGRDEYILRDEAICINGIYYSEDDVAECPHCGENYYTEGDDVYHSDLLDEDFCCEDCALAAEEIYREEHDIVEV